MVKRRKSGLDQAIEVVAKLPWRVSAVLVPVSYAVLHFFASTKAATPTNMNQIGSVFVAQLISTICTIGQYLLPLIFFAGAAVSYFEARKRSDRYELTATHSKHSSLLNMTWQDFEGLVAEHFKRKGFTVTINGGAGADGGVDVELTKGSELSLVQCKQWRATAVGVDVVRELYGVMAARGAASGYVVTSAVFTPDAKAFANGRNINLVDGEKLILDMKKNPPPDNGFIPSPVAVDVLSCPRCSAVMVKRVAKTGTNAGQYFWGCQRYPACKGTRSA